MRKRMEKKKTEKQERRKRREREREEVEKRGVVAFYLMFGMKSECTTSES